MKVNLLEQTENSQYQQIKHSCPIFQFQSPIWSVQSSGDFIDRYRATLVFYAHVKTRAAFAEAFVRG